MAAVSIRDLDDGVREKIRLRAARNGRSMEAEIRIILSDAVKDPATDNLVTTLVKRFAEIGGVELDLPPRSARPRAADLQA